MLNFHKIKIEYWKVIEEDSSLSTEGRKAQTSEKKRRERDAAETGPGRVIGLRG